MSTANDTECNDQVIPVSRLVNKPLHVAYKALQELAPLHAGYQALEQLAPEQAPDPENDGGIKTHNLNDIRALVKELQLCLDWQQKKLNLITKLLHDIEKESKQKTSKSDANNPPEGLLGKNNAESDKQDAEQNQNNVEFDTSNDTEIDDEQANESQDFHNQMIFFGELFVQTGKSDDILLLSDMHSKHVMKAMEQVKVRSLSKKRMISWIFKLFQCKPQTLDDEVGVNATKQHEGFIGLKLRGDILRKIELESKFSELFVATKSRFDKLFFQDIRATCINAGCGYITNSEITETVLSVFNLYPCNPRVERQGRQLRGFLCLAVKKTDFDIESKMDNKRKAQEDNNIVRHKMQTTLQNWADTVGLNSSAPIFSQDADKSKQSNIIIPALDVVEEFQKCIHIYRGNAYDIGAPLLTKQLVLGIIMSKKFEKYPFAQQCLEAAKKGSADNFAFTLMAYAFPHIKPSKRKVIMHDKKTEVNTFCWVGLAVYSDFKFN